MDEEEFDALKMRRPFGTEDATRWFAQNRAETRLLMKLGSALWGTTPEDLQGQLLRPFPEIPAGFDVVDFRRLLLYAARLSSALLALQRARGLPPTVVPPPVVFVGTSGLTLWEARCEIVRRAIEYLEKR